jgi:hydrogenase maturation protein HypF
MRPDRKLPPAGNLRLRPAGRAARITVGGVVQGVGFRPFLHRLAKRFGYTGWVKNTGRGVRVHFESQRKTDFAPFLRALEEDKPPLLRVEKIDIRPAAFRGFATFEIRPTEEGESFVFISPDIATCKPCRDEIADPRQRRHRYPFTNCTDCGPRYTIVRSLPYDRPKTTMAGFEMCADCRREYENPADRRYHAQPIACPACGPRVTLRDARSGQPADGGIETAVDLIRKGRILAVKGLGGFHLVCDPRNQAAVRRLRAVKGRLRKPLALMADDIATIEKLAFVGPAERRALLSASRPIVLLRKKKDLPGISPHLDETGFMLPYTPLHCLLLEGLGLIVATSSNPKDAPIAKDENEGIGRLCDFILTHNRPIETRADDSVVKLAAGRPLFLRRARGYVPYPQRVPARLESPVHVLALGGELKDTVSVYKDGYVITSQFLGDLDDYRNFRYFEETVAHLERLFAVRPGVVVSDLHPDFRTTRYAQGLGLPHLQVQHHYAHVLAVLLEHAVPPSRKVLGVAFDGYGYGEDGGAWGGEFLLSDYTSFTRLAHFKPVPLPGGDRAAREPWRMALAYLREAFGKDAPALPCLEKVDPNTRRLVIRMMSSGINSPVTSSCGRLFDAVSYLAGLAPVEVEYEAEAPLRLEAVSRLRPGAAYPFDFLTDSEPWRLSFGPAIRRIAADVSRKTPPEEIGGSFHRTLAEAIAAVSERARRIHGVDAVALVGGVFLNKTLVTLALRALERRGFEVLIPRQYSPNDESISIGQVAYALARLKSQG